MSSSGRSSAKRKATAIQWIGAIFLLVSIHVPVTNSLKLSINEDFYQTGQDEDIMNPCVIPNTEDNPDPFGYCSCEFDSPINETNVKCFFRRDPTAIEWKGIGKFKNGVSIELKIFRGATLRRLPPPYLFAGMYRLNYFTLKRAELQNIQSFAFGNSSSLNYVDLNDNSIHTLSSYSFANLMNISVINLSENNLTQINRDVFVNLPKLKELVLSRNSIQTMHDNALRGLNNLTDLALQYNQLSVITRDVFNGLESVVNLDLSRNQIQFIGDHVFAEMPVLADLDLSENKIKVVSSTAFQGLIHLKRLNLKDNKIVRLLPMTFAHLNEVHFLDLKSNELETLSEELMRPIYKNLQNSHMNLLVEGNRFLCDCRITWIRKLFNETNSTYIRDHLQKVTCNLFDNMSKHVASASSSSATYYPTDNANSDIKMLTNPPEETAAFAFESERFILNLTASDLNCPERVADTQKGRDPAHHRNHDGSRAHHHHSSSSQQSSQDKPYSTYNRPKFADENRKHTEHTEWDANSESHQQDHHTDGISSEERSGGVNSGVHRQISTLNEPQATAALEGEDTGSSAPKHTSAGDQKVDTTSRVSSGYAEEDSSAAAKIGFCDSCFLATILSSIFMTLILM